MENAIHFRRAFNLFTRTWKASPPFSLLMKEKRIGAAYLLCGAFLWGCLLKGCASVPSQQLERADTVAETIITEKQQQALGKIETISIVPPAETLRQRLLLDQNLPYQAEASLGSEYLSPIPHWPEIQYPQSDKQRATGGIPLQVTDKTLSLSLLETLQIGARNNNQYQRLKEDIFQAALDLDLERHEFRTTFSGLLEVLFSSDMSGEQTVSGIEGSAIAGLSRKFASGIEFTLQLGLDLVKLLTMDRSSASGVLGDATVSIPLLRGSGKHIVTEPLTQAERNVTYAIFLFERYKRTFAVQVASDYLNVLRQLDEIENAQQNYTNLLESAARARRMADAGRLPEVQVDQAIQDALRARDRLLAAQQVYALLLDEFKIFLGLPPDADVLLQEQELVHIAKPVSERQQTQAVETKEERSIDGIDAQVMREIMQLAPKKSFDISEDVAIRTALANRLDLRVAEGQVFDAQRTVVVAADGLRAEATILGSAAAGGRRNIASVDEPNARFRPERGSYEALLSLDLPLERTAERNALRNSLIDLERTVRSYQELEDQVKLEIRNGQRNLVEFRQRIGIQAKSVEVARRRVTSTTLFLQAGRVEIRDVLEAQEALVQALNQLTEARVNYRVAMLQLQKDLGTLQVTPNGLINKMPANTLRSPSSS